MGFINWYLKDFCTLKRLLLQMQNSVSMYSIQKSVIDYQKREIKTLLFDYIES